MVIGRGIGFPLGCRAGGLPGGVERAVCELDVLGPGLRGGLPGRCFKRGSCRGRQGFQSGQVAACLGAGIHDTQAAARQDLEPEVGATLGPFGSDDDSESACETTGYVTSQHRGHRV